MNSDPARLASSDALVSTPQWLRRRRSPVGGALFTAYRFRVMRPVVRVLLRRLEGGMMMSSTWRLILDHYEGVRLGEFSYGPGLRPGLFAPGTDIGRYCSFAKGLEVLRRNHTVSRWSQHPLFFNPMFGIVKTDARPEAHRNRLSIGNDVWIGLNVILCPGCRVIGDGAIVGAGSVVTRDVPPFTIVAGNPARVVRKRFSPEIEEVVTASQWWRRPLPELVVHLDLFTEDISDDSLRRFAVAFPAHDTAIHSSDSQVAEGS